MTLEEIKTAIEASVPAAQLEIIPNPSPSAQHSLLVSPASALAVATFLRDDPRYKLDFLSSVTGVDWPIKETTEKIKTKQLVDNPDDPAGPKIEKDVEEVKVTRTGGYLEAVYHLYSMELKHGPVILRLRTADREANTQLPSLTPVWRSAEFQEREALDLYGIVFTGHPDLRRILMWDEFTGFPMRKDYVQPDDYEFEPTAHDEVLERARAHRTVNA